jgi:hemoglobin
LTERNPGRGEPPPAPPSSGGPVTEEAIRRLLDAFYARVREDEALGPIFAAKVGTTEEDWAPHLARLQDFWSQVMLRGGRYTGNPYQAHLRLLPELRPEMFGRWLALFDAACDETLPSEAAELFHERATAIARSLRMGLFEPLPVRHRGGAEPDPSDAGALPPGLQWVRSTPVFTEGTVPAGLLQRHRTAPGTWGLIRVLEGRLQLRMLDPPEERMLDPTRRPAVVAPGVPHEVAPLGPVRFLIEFHRSPAAPPPRD